MRKLLASSIVALMIGMPASASDWWFVSSGSDAPHIQMFFVDKASIHDIGGGIRRAWTAQTMQKSGTSAFSLKILSEYNCKENKNRVVSSTAFSSDGNIVGNLAGQREWEYLIPDSTGEAMANFICRGELGPHSSELLPETSPESISRKIFSDAR